MAWQPHRDNRNGSGNGRDDNVYKFPNRPRRPDAEWPVSASFLGLVAAWLIVGTIMYVTPQFARGAVFPFVLAGWLITLCLHEFGHAYTAYHFGDRSVREKGYLTLDPVKYADPINSILFPVLILAFGGLGLPGGAVYVQKHLFRERWQMSACSAAGPAFDLLSLLVLAALLWIFAGPLASAPVLRSSLTLIAMLQVVSLVLNLLPVPGLDGWGILEPWLPRHIREPANQMAPLVMMGFLLALLFVPGLSTAIFSGVGGVMSALGLSKPAADAAFRLFQFWR